MSTLSDPTMAELATRAEAALPGGTSVAFQGPADVPLALESGEGAVVRGVDGREWIDYVLGSGPMILGHAHPDVVEAVGDRLDKGFTFYAINRLAVELAEQVNDAVPCAEQTKFTCAGSEATFYALRIARAATGRDIVIRLEGGYHGHHDYAVMGMAPPEPLPPFEARADSAGVPAALEELVRVVPFNSADALGEALARHRGRVAAVLMEPYQRAIPPRPGYLEAVRRLTRQEDVLLIFDEIVTGFRLAYGGAQERYGVVPDMCAVGKILGGGFALAAVAGPMELMAHADPRRHSGRELAFWNGTLNANPIAAAAGLATLAELRRPGVYERLFEVGERMRGGLAEVLARHGVAGCVLGEGPMFYVEYTDGPVEDYRGSARGDKALLRRVGEEMIRRGHLWNPVQRNYISLAHTDEQIDATVAAYDAALEAVLTG